MGHLRKIKMVIGYDGTDFAGFQRQKELRTVQRVLEESIEKLTGEKVRVKGAGRTDRGVHARGQVIAFDTRSTIPGDRFAEALRPIVPQDIIVVSSQEVSDDFDPVADALDKTYCYRIWRGDVEHLFLRRYSLWLREPLDFNLIVDETKHIEGKRDFKNLRATGSSAKTTVRTVKSARWVQKSVSGQENALWEFWITADGFLYKMVRMIVGTLIDEARGFLPEGTLRKALESPEKVRVGKTVPGKGLCLEEVRFRRE